MQNAANSMVGLGVIQIARNKGIKTINIVRADRYNICSEYMVSNVTIPPNFMDVGPMSTKR